MKKQDLINELEAELKRTYHNATLHGKLRTESDYECDMVQAQIQIECEQALLDIENECPNISYYGEVFQWGRGGRTVAPCDIVNRRGGGAFSIKRVQDLGLDYAEMRRLLKDLKSFNDYVYSFCNSVSDSTINYVREEFAAEIEQNKNKKRIQFKGVRYE